MSRSQATLVGPLNAEALIAQTPNLPVPSRSATLLLRLLASDDLDHEAVIAALQKDGVLSTKVLAVCNSAAFGLASPVGSISQAVLYVGYEELHRIVMNLAFGGALGRNLPGYFLDEGAFWRHSLHTALISQTVVRAVTAVETDASVAYTAGLIHDIGKLVMSHALGVENQDLVRELVERGGRSLIEAEQEVIGADHAEVGACLLRQWNLPEVLIEAVAGHHHPPLSPRLELSSIIHVADFVAHQGGSSPGWGSYGLRRDESVIEALGLTADHFEALIVSAYEAVVQIEESMAVVA